MEEKTIDLEGLLVSFQEEGQGPFFLILHGWKGSSLSWKNVVQGLSSFFTVISLDLPGFGKSQNPPFAFDLEDFAKVLNSFCQKREIKEIFLLGHSFGGAVAVIFTILFPQMVKKLILCAPALLRSKKKNFKQRFFNFLATTGNKIFNQKPPFFLKKIIYRIINNYDYFDLNPVMKETFKKIIKRDLREDLSQIDIPTLILWGEKDKILPLFQAFFIKEKIKNSQLEIL
ncbi:MAG: alpha/beta fold hydrolase, partial [Minisyncoccales bacterium]